MNERASTATKSTTEMATNVGSASASAVRQTGAGMRDAALSPLEDLNLRRDEIPEQLAIMESPYVLPANMTCADLERRVGQLDALLGDDWDAEEGEERLRSERFADSAADFTLNTLASEARGLIPFRGVVRYASGASKHEKAYNRAFRIGAHRRAYLKGIGLAMGCKAPAAPRALPTKLVTLGILSAEEPVVIEVPRADSSSPDLRVVTEVKVLKPLENDRPVITYRQSIPSSQTAGATTSSPPTALTTPREAQETSRPQ